MRADHVALDPIGAQAIEQERHREAAEDDRRPRVAVRQVFSDLRREQHELDHGGPIIARIATTPTHATGGATSAMASAPS